MKKYFIGLTNHPGVPVAVTLQVFGFLAGLDKVQGFWFFNGLTGAVIMSVFWIPVLLTVRVKN